MPSLKIDVHPYDICSAAKLFYDASGVIKNIFCKI